VHFKGVAVLHVKLRGISAKFSEVSPFRPPATYRVEVVCRINGRAFKQEPHAVHILALAVAEGVHELAQSRGTFDLEEDLVVVVGDLRVPSWYLSHAPRAVLHLL
jgi:hypothetical protein